MSTITRQSYDFASSTASRMLAGSSLNMLSISPTCFLVVTSLDLSLILAALALFNANP